MMCREGHLPKKGTRNATRREDRMSEVRIRRKHK